MLTKPRDERYCDCRELAILSYNGDIDMENIKVLYHYVTERCRIYSKRLAGDNPPWTNDEILIKYSFTNIRREHDKTTKWLINNISTNDNLSIYDKFYNSMLFRMYNRIDTAKMLELDKPINYKKYNEYFTLLNDKKSDCYTRAFKTIGLRNGIRKKYLWANDRILPLLYIEDLRKENNKIIPKKLYCANNQKEAYNWFLSIDGIGIFMAYQFFVDMTYIDEFPFSENEFVVCGPGAIKGLSYLFPKKCELTYSEQIFWLRDNIDNLFSKIDPKYSPEKLFKSIGCEDYDCCWNVMSLENCMCELSKYMWSYKGLGSPTRRYKSGDGER